MKKMNKKGFTLVELLAVIVILAVVILIAVTAVIPRMNKAKKKAFDDEALAFINAAEEYVVVENAGVWPTAGVNLSSLVGTYVEVKNGKTYTGCVKQVTESSVTKTKIWITDGTKYVIDGLDATAVQSTGASEGTSITASAC